MRNTILTSNVTCPNCGQTTACEMPTDACQFFLECPACHQVMRPLSGDCCVYCSYGDVRCPSKQTGPSGPATLRNVGVIGLAVTAVCCATPLLAFVLPAVGLGALAGYIDRALIPLLAAFLALIIYAEWRRRSR